MKVLSAHQPQYLPWLGLFHKAAQSDAFVVMDDVQYKKREFQNRNKIRGKESWMWLTVPVKVRGLYHQSIREVAIDNGRNWRDQHRKSLEHCYGRAPYFSLYEKEMLSFYENPWERLCDLNLAMLQFFLNMLGIKPKIVLESTLGIATQKTRRLVDLCLRFQADTYLSGAGGREYLEEGLFKEADIRLTYQDFKHPEYPQAFPGFEPFMGIVDLLFNCGPESSQILLGRS